MFKGGDIVRLKSGGPTMTVDKVNNSKVSCVWFKDDRLKTAIFRKDTLELVSEGKKHKASKLTETSENAEGGKEKAKPKTAVKTTNKS